MAGWSLAVESRNNTLSGCIFWTQENGGLTGVPLAHNQFGRCCSAATNPAGRIASSSDGRGCEKRCRQLFRHLAFCWDGRHRRKSLVSPDFECRQAREVLWLNNFYQPARVFVQLPALGVEMEMGICPGASDRNSPDDRTRRRGYGGGVTAETVSKLCHQGCLIEAVEALEWLVQTERCVSKSLLCTVLRQCAVKRDLALGSRIHALSVHKGYQSDTVLCNHILRMYASHGRLRDAMDVFETVAQPDAFTWSAIISAHVKHGQDRQAIQLYHRMRRSRVKPDGHVFVAALQACARGSDMQTGQQVHADALACGVELDLFVGSCLVDMYAKCGSLENAQGVFDRLGDKNVVTWTSLIAGYSQHGMAQEALQLYIAMQEEGMAVPNCFTFVCLLQACASVGALALEQGKQLHNEIRDRGHEADVFVASSLVNMYAKCGSLDEAQRVFDGLGQKNEVTWTAMIAGYAQKGMGQKALRLYSAMRQDGKAVPNCVTFVCLLQACASVGSLALATGKQLHMQIREQGHEADAFVASSLMNMYAKCGNLEDAQRVFDGLCRKDVVTWTAMIAGYSQQGMGQEALCLYRAMHEDGMAAPDPVTFVCLLQACASVGIAALELGKRLHMQIREQGHEADGVVSNSLVSMYVKCGSLEHAQRLFDQLSCKDVVTWNAMIAGYSKQGMGQEALRLYRTMVEEGMASPDSVTFVCLLQACANVAALYLGKQLHLQIVEQGLQADLFLAGSLINMYSKSGSMVAAQQVFDAMPERTVIAWSALIAGYSYQGESEVVFGLFERMREDGVQPDGITFLSVLTVCSHAGLVKQGWEYFDAMSRQFGISPTQDHYTCMVDLLGRAGQLDEALGLVRSMPVSPNAAVWCALLGACRKWSNVEVGHEAFTEAVKIDKKDPVAYVLMSNIYTSAQMWERAWEFQTRRKSMRPWKQPGQSWWTDKEGTVHSFLAGDETILESRGRPNQVLSKRNKLGYMSHLRLNNNTIKWVQVHVNQV